MGNCHESANVAEQPPLKILNEIRALYDAGLNLQAYRASVPYVPLKQWTGARAQTLAGQLAANIGAYKLAHVLHWIAWRSGKTNPELIAYHGDEILKRRGPLTAFEFLENCGESSPSADGKGMVPYYLLRARVAGRLRDFNSSEIYFKQAEILTPEQPQVLTMRAHLFEQQDRYGEALIAARHSLKRNPSYSPAIQAAAHFFQVFDKEDEAHTLLKEAADRVENMHVVRQLAELQLDLGLYDDCRDSLARFERLAPMMEKADATWLERTRITLNCLREDWASALEGAKEINIPYYQELARRLESGASRRRVLLDVPFVRQHHMTCAPATLSAISGYWKKPASHLEIAESICYEGTASYSERHWAESNGWESKEFRVTWEASVQLLDQGIPFTLTTAEATSGHLQAVVGYDELRQTLLIRDPFVYAINEVVAEHVLEHYRATGPRGMAMVPIEQAERLSDIGLPESDLYEQLYKVQKALAEHQRDEAVRASRQMTAEQPNHRLALTARRAVATYDSNTHALLEVLEELLKQFPDDGNLQLARLSCLREFGRRNEVIALLEKQCAGSNVAPVFYQSYAQELLKDPNQLQAAASWVRWALRSYQEEPGLVKAWADILWDDGKRDHALLYYRIAACLGDKNESFARSHFVALRRSDRTEAGIAFLKKRVEAQISAAPAVTLIETLRHLNRPDEAFEILHEALEQFPDDGRLRLFAAEFYGGISQFQTAERLLDEARDNCPAAAWHRCAASLAEHQGHKKDALTHWREVLTEEPSAQDALEALTGK